MKGRFALDLVVTGIILSLVVLGFNVSSINARQAQTSEVDEQSAAISNIIGEVYILVEGETVWVPASDDIALHAGDKISSNSASTATLTYFEGSQTLIFPYSVLEISEMRASHDTGENVILINQWLGRTFNRVVRLLDFDSRFEIETPNAVTAVRGTEFWVKYEEGITQIDVEEGVVEVTGGGKTVQVESGQSTIVPQGKVPLPTEPSELSDSTFIDQDGNPIDPNPRKGAGDDRKDDGDDNASSVTAVDDDTSDDDSTATSDDDSDTGTSDDDASPATAADDDDDGKSGDDDGNSDDDDDDGNSGDDDDDGSSGDDDGSSD